VRVVAKYDPLLINEIKSVTLTELNDNGLVEVSEPEIMYESHTNTKLDLEKAQ
jgi:threonylcarbamoyladenosine tRNA methylthiotransferase MtaB